MKFGRERPPCPPAEICELCGWRHGIGRPCIEVMVLGPGDTRSEIAHYWGGPEVQRKSGKAGARARFGYERMAKK